MPVPHLRLHSAFGLVAQVLINRGYAVGPHSAAILIVEQDRALQKIFVVTIDRPADVTVGVSPFSRLDIDPRSDQTNGRAAIVNLNQSALGLLVEDRPVRKFAERAKLNQQSPRLRRIGYVAAHFAGLEIDVAIRQAGWRSKDRQQAVAQILRQIQKTLVARHLVTRKQ